MALDRAHVVKTALDLLDEVGLDGLSLRRLAKELGVQAPALYWHFKNKQELLDQMVEELARTEAPLVPPAEGETWDVWFSGRARQMRRALNAHRDGAMLAASTHPQADQWSEIEMQLNVLCSAGLTAREGMHAMVAVGNYVSGFTLEEQADRLRGDVPEPDPEHFAEILRALEPYPRATEALRTAGDPQSDESFEAGLQIIMDGLRKRVAERSASR